MDIIFDFIQWPLNTDADLAMEVFLEDFPERGLDRERVIEFLMSFNPNLSIQYLDHLIHERGETSPRYHDQLARLLLDVSKTSDSKAKLEDFLESSNEYTPRKIFHLLPSNDSRYLPSRAIVLGRLGEHEKALQIYVYDLHNYLQAEAYCHRFSKSSFENDENSPNMHQILLHVYLHPPKDQKIAYTATLEYLSRHGAHIDASDTVDLLPEDISVKGDLQSFLRSYLRHNVTDLNSTRMLGSLNRVDQVRVQENLLGLRNKSVVVRPTSVCPHCHKRLGQSVVAMSQA